MTRPLDNERRNTLATECNVYHLYTMHMILAMAELDNAHRYRLRVEHVFDVDDTKSIASFVLTYTHKGKTVSVAKTRSYQNIINLRQADTTRKNSQQLMQLMAAGCLEEWGA